MNRTVVPLVFAVALAAVTGPAVAQSDVYKCVDDRGSVTFANTGSTKGCTKLNVDPVVIPKYQAPKSGNSAANNATNPGFPKVDGATQKARDSDRRRILEDELRDKQTKLADLKREFNNGEPERRGDERNYQRYIDRVDRLKSDIARTEGDVASIKAEIDKVQ